MRTQLGTYCQQFDGTLRPVLTSLAGTLDSLHAAAPDTPGRALETPLLELQHQLRALCDKVEGQQAYVLIFGPLKSGKSTLMNAIAAAYVSEVSSLPAYPCLVFVRSGRQREYVVTCYDGSTRTHRDAQALHRDIDAAHTELAQAIRQAEQRGAAFDPQEHFPQAIRRIDVHVADSALATSGAVLVDTPGLYTRMRFGYDRMTRDFRNAAACAIFVVKSDTLFLEQVFAEFQQLLDLFSRIFLVVNVDSRKRDVSPDGSLVPSLEQSEPGAILRAFEQLAMSAPLQRAASEGRVRMYPVDLLAAASTALTNAPSATTNEAAHDGSGFAPFQRDLEDYLASSEYLAAFLHDSLQRADVLLKELLAHTGGDQASDVRGRLADTDEQLAWIAAEEARTRRALALDWTEAFARGRREIEAELQRTARDAGARLLRTLGASIDTWFLSSHGLDWLVRGQWTPLIRDYREDVRTAGQRAFEQLGLQVDAGLDLPDGLPELVRRAGIDLRRLKESALADIGEIGWSEPATVPVDLDRIPLRKGVFDVVAFRSLHKVRARLFGPADKPDHKIPGKEKAKHLGEAGRLHLHQCVSQFRAALLPATVAATSEHFGTAFTAAAAAALRKGLEAYLPRLAEKAAKLQSERTRLAAVAGPIESLHALALDLRPKLDALDAQFSRETTEQPAEAPVVLVPPPRPDAKVLAAKAPARTKDGQPQRSGS
jgi:hypothetical protein